MKLLDLCCGAGGWSLGAKLAGWTVEGIDLDMDAVATYQANVAPAARADIRQVRGIPRGGLFVGGGAESAIDIAEGPIEIVIGGVPCQPYSIAGKREGEAHEDGTLWLEWLRIAVELQAEAIALENVRGFATWDGGRFIRHVIQTVEGKGFHTAWQVLDAADYGVPQHRDRIFLVGFRSPEARARFRWPEPTHGPPGHLWLPRYRTVRDALGIPPGDYRAGRREGAKGWQGERMLDVDAPSPAVGTTAQEMLDRPSPCITASGHDATGDPKRPSLRPIANLRKALLDAPSNAIKTNMDGFSKEYVDRLRTAGILDCPSTVVACDPRLAPAGHHEHAREGAVRLGPAELALLQGFPPGFRFAGNKTSQYRQIGNAVPLALGGAVCSAIARALGT